MTGNTLTNEQIQRKVMSAFDSVNIIVNNISEEKNDNRKKLIENNYKHLEIMFNKDWFFDALSETQKTTIKECIMSGITYFN